MAVSLIRIRRAQCEDIPVLLMLLAHQIEQAQEQRRMRFSPSHLEQLLSSPESPLQVLIAELDQVPMGFLSFFSTYSGFQEGLRPILRLDLLFVLSERHHRNISTALLKTLARIAQARGCYRIEWMFSVTYPQSWQLPRRIKVRVSDQNHLAWLDRVAIEQLSL